MNQNFLQPTIPVAPGVSLPTPLGFMPFGFPLAANFKFAYSNQANLAIERDLGRGFALNIAYTFNGGVTCTDPSTPTPPPAICCSKHLTSGRRWSGISDEQPSGVSTGCGSSQESWPGSH